MRIKVFLLVALVFSVPVVMAGQTSAANATVTTTFSNAFSPLNTNISAGDSVDFTGLGGGTHTVKFEDGAPGSGPSATTFRRPFPTAGTYRYYCEIHGAAGGIGMYGTVTVGAAATATPTVTPTNTPAPTATPRSACGSSTIAAPLLTSPATTAYGGVRFTMNTAGTAVTVHWALNGLSSNLSGLSIRRGNGDVVVPAAGGSFTGFPSNTNAGTFDTTITDAADLSAFSQVMFNPQGFNVVVATVNNPGGELTGALACAPDVAASTVQGSFSGSAQVPAVTTNAKGTVSLALGAGGTVIDGVWSVSGLSSNATAAHIHVGLAGANGPVIVDFTSQLPAASGMFTTHTTGVPTSVIRAIQYAPYGFYVNIHTTTNAGGEARGQLAALRHFLGSVSRNAVLAAADPRR